MGSHFVNAVINGLKGLEISYSSTDSKGKEHVRTFGVSDLALMAVIANRQPNPGYKGNDDTICYGDAKTLCDLSHIKKSSLFSIRNFLVNVGLIKFTECEGDNTNVYRINVGKIRELCKEQKEKWSSAILKLQPDDVKILNSKQRRILCIDDAPIPEVQNLENPVQNLDSGVQNLDSGVQNLDSGVQNLDTNININKKKNTNINIHTNNGDDGGVDEIWNYERTRKTCAWINDNCSLHLDVGGLMSVLRGHSREEVISAVKAAIEDLDNNTGTIKTREGFFINQLKAHLASGVKPSGEDRKSKFTKPKRKMTREEFAEDWWQRIDDDFGFKKSLSEDEYNELKTWAIGKICNYRNSQLKELMELVVYNAHDYLLNHIDGVTTAREALEKSMNEHT